MKKIKNIFTCILIGCLITTATPVLANSLNQTIEVVFNAVKVQVNGENKDVESILYNGTTYLPMRKVAELVGKDIEWNQQTMTANIVNKKAISNELPTIIDYGFTDDLSLYGVDFSDGISVWLSNPKISASSIQPFYERILVFVNGENMSVSTPNIIGFNEQYGYKYQPIKYETYSKYLFDDFKSGFKEVDFYENFKLYNGNSFDGAVYFDSFPYLDGITYDDGVHKCTLYLEDKARY